MKIMVTGHSGMLGWEVSKAIKRMGHERIINEEIDITKVSNLKGNPEVVINCAGLVPQHIPSPFPAAFMLVNGYGPWNLADHCDQIAARLIQVSTDCVFDGAGEGPHLERTPPLPITAYGHSKLAGEIYREPHLTVRTSFVGFGKHGLIAELEKYAQDEEIYQASDELLWTGHTARFIAEALVMLAEKAPHGLLHIPGESMTRLELVRLLKNSLGLDVSFQRAYDPSIDRRLGSERWAKEGLPDLPSFEWQLEWLRRSQ